MAGGVLRRVGGGYVLGPGGSPVRVGNVVALPLGPRTVSPTSITVSNTISPGTELAALTFSNYPQAGGVTSSSGDFSSDFSEEFSRIADVSSAPFTTEFTNEFAGIARTVTLTDNSSDRVALTGSWVTGYKLVAGTGTMTPGTWTISLQVSGYPETLSISLTIEAPAVTGAVLFTAAVENFDTVASWPNQEVSIAQWFKKGDVPVGAIAVITVDGVRVPQQVSNRTTWNDGSLKLAQVRFLMPVIPAGQTKTVTWQRASGTWTANDTPLHTATTAVTNNVDVEFTVGSFKSRTVSGTTTTLGTEQGPVSLKSTVMLDSRNSQWIEKIMSGPVCNEWRVTDMGRLGFAYDSPRHADWGGILYIRTWGGTASAPTRIQFLFRSIYGWSTEVAATAQGLRLSVDVKVNAVAIRGGSLGTTDWGAMNTWKGGFIVSAGTEGTMDWYDVATRQVVTMPKIIYRHNIPYGVSAKFVPPFDTNNPSFPMTAQVFTYGPTRRGPLRHKQDDVGDDRMIAWTTTKPMAWAIAAHARANAQQLSDHQRTARVAALGMGAMTGVGFNRVTRKIICYMPPVKSTNQASIGASVWDGTTPASIIDPANLAESLRYCNPPSPGSDPTKPEIAGLDSAHFPQIALWPYISEGDQHWLDLVYHEATLPSLFTPAPNGFYGTAPLNKIPYGGIVHREQIRAVGHTVRAIANAVGAGNPSDPHWVMVRDLLDHQFEMITEAILQEDQFRGGMSRTDGRRMQDLKVLRPLNEPVYTVWQHAFGLHATSYAYGISEYPKLKEWADWWSHCPTVCAGGYHNDVGDEYYLMKPDPVNACEYMTIVMNGMTDNVENRRFWYYGQWRGFGSPVTYKADGQTCVWTDYAVSPGIPNGVVVSISGVRDTNQPFWVLDSTKVPTGITKGIPYYTAQASGNTSKLSLNKEGTSIVTFSTGGVDMVGQAVRSPVAGYHTVRAASALPSNIVGDADYLNQVKCALDMYQHYVDPHNARVLLARQKLAALKAGSTNPNGYDERAKTTVPLTAPAASPPPDPNPAPDPGTP